MTADLREVLLQRYARGMVRLRRTIALIILAISPSCVLADQPLELAPAASSATRTPRAAPEQQGARGEAEGIALVVADGVAIPPGLLIGVLWTNEDAEPPFAVSPITTITGADGALRIFELPSPPPPMLRRVDDVEFALGLVVAFNDNNGDGALTPAPTKPWRWPEFRGGINEHALVYTSGEISEGSRLHRRFGALPGGLQVVQVALTAVCEGDGCAGHDQVSLAPRPRQMTLVLPKDPAGYRFPNLD
jgi:hypothetical protein